MEQRSTKRRGPFGIARDFPLDHPILFVIAISILLTGGTVIAATTLISLRLPQIIGIDNGRDSSRLLYRTGRPVAPQDPLATERFHPLGSLSHPDSALQAGP